MSVLTKLADVAKRITGARDALAQVHQVEADLRAAHAQAQQERESLLSSRPPKADVIANLHREVDAAARAWREANAQQILDAAGGIAVDFLGNVEGLRGSNISGGNVFGLLGPLYFNTLCGLAADVVKASLAAAVEAAPPYPAGPPLADRLALLAACDERLTRLEADHSSLVDDARDNGIMLDLLAPVAARRRAAATKR